MLSIVAIVSRKTLIDTLLGRRLLPTSVCHTEAGEEIQYVALDIVNAIGILTIDTVPGLNRHWRNAEVDALSRIGQPVLTRILALVTLPLAPMSMTTTALPVWRRERAA